MEWRAIPGWEGRYEASDGGQVRSLDRIKAAVEHEKAQWSGDYRSAAHRALDDFLTALSKGGQGGGE